MRNGIITHKRTAVQTEVEPDIDGACYNVECTEVVLPIFSEKNSAHTLPSQTHFKCKGGSSLATAKRF